MHAFAGARTLDYKTDLFHSKWYVYHRYHSCIVDTCIDIISEITITLHTLTHHSKHVPTEWSILWTSPGYWDGCASSLTISQSTAQSLLVFTVSLSLCLYVHVRMCSFVNSDTAIFFTTKHRQVPCTLQLHYTLSGWSQRDHTPRPAPPGLTWPNPPAEPSMQFTHSTHSLSGWSAPLTSHKHTPTTSGHLSELGMTVWSVHHDRQTDRGNIISTQHSTPVQRSLHTADRLAQWISNSVQCDTCLYADTV